MKKHTGFWLTVVSALSFLPGSAALARDVSPVGTSSFQAANITVVAAIRLPVDIDDLMPSWIGSSSSSTERSSSSSSRAASSSSVSSRSSSAQSSAAPRNAPRSGLSSIRQQVIDLVNQVRRENGLGALQAESHLTDAAQTHAEDMAKRGYFAHNTPEGKKPSEQIRDAGYPLRGKWYTGQNIARGQETAAKVMQDWMNSPGHRKNILSKNFKDIGIGFYQDHWVQDFGSHTK